MAEGEATEEAVGGDRDAVTRIEMALPRSAARCAPEVPMVAAPSLVAHVARAPTESIEAATPRRAAPRSWIAQIVLAGMIGGGSAAVVFGVVWMIDAARIARPLSDGSAPLVFLLDAVLGVLVALRFGYRERARSASERVLRGVGVLIPGAMAWGAVLLAVLGVTSLGSREELTAAVWFSVLGCMMTIAGTLLERRKTKIAVARFEELKPALPQDRRNTPLAWSGVLAGSLALWASTSLVAYDKDVSRLHDGPLTLLIGVALIGAFALATTRGYAPSVRPRIRLHRRLGGTIGFGFLAALGLALLFAIFEGVWSPHRSTERVVLVLVPALVACMALAGVHLLTPPSSPDERRGSLREAVIVGTAILFGTLYTQSTWVRYATGSERAAIELANDHYEDGDFEIAARYFEIACNRGDDLACVRASAAYDAGLGVHVDSRHADALLRLACDDPDACLDLAGSTGNPRTKERAAKRACDLAGGKYCERYRLAVLSGACEQRDVFACRDLARANEGNGMAPFFYQKACSFGDVEACAKAR